MKYDRYCSFNMFLLYHRLCNANLSHYDLNISRDIHYHHRANNKHVIN